MEKAEFIEYANFVNAQFLGIANFCDITFSNECNFSGTRFTKWPGGIKFDDSFSYSFAIFGWLNPRE